MPPVPYHIVETDYTSYSCVYSCFDLLNIRAELFFILSRTPEISPEARRRCLDLFEEKGVDTGKLQEMQQEGCPREGEGVGEEVVEAGEVVEEEVVEAGEVVDAREVAEDEAVERDEGEEMEVPEDDKDDDGVHGNALQNADEIPEGSGRRDSEVREDADGSAAGEGRGFEDNKDSSANEALSVDPKACSEEADGETSADTRHTHSESAKDGNEIPVDEQMRDERYMSEEDYGVSFLEGAEDIVHELEEDVVRAVDIIENSASELIEETSEILEIQAKDGKKTSFERDERTRSQGLEEGGDYSGSSSPPPPSLPTAASMTFAALCLFLHR